MKLDELALGTEVEDIVTGFKGIATSYVVYINGCIQVCIRGKAIDNKVNDESCVYVDIQQARCVGEGVVKYYGFTASLVQENIKGGPQRDAPNKVKAI